MVLRFPSNFALNTIYKGCDFSKAFFQEDFKLVPSRRNNLVTLNFGFILFPAEEDIILQKKNHKSYSSLVSYSTSFKIILTLSGKVVTFYMWGFIVLIRVLGLEQSVQCVFLISSFYRSGILTVFHKVLHKLSKQVLLRNRTWSRRKLKTLSGLRPSY